MKGGCIWKVPAESSLHQSKEKTAERGKKGDLPRNSKGERKAP